VPLRVRNTANLVANEVVIVAERPGEFAAILTDLEPAPGSDGPCWTMSLTIGEGAAARDVTIALSPFLSRAEYEFSLNEPVIVAASMERRSALSRRNIRTFALFRNHFFLPERNPSGNAERQELILRAKRAVYKHEEELKSLRSYVSNVEVALQYERDGPRRTAIPGDVKLLVWTRDGGACVLCGSREKLHFDHIIPVAKGGSNDAKNIQVLCEPCNLKKSDKIGI
jgi:hypothetical protein